MAKRFFSIIPADCIYRHLPTTFEKAETLVDNLTYFYNYQHIQPKPEEAPLTQCLSE